MSGGSHHYLCYNAPGELRSLAERIQGMADALRTGGFNLAADRTERISMGLFWMEGQANELAEVWKAQEWYNSGDWGRDAIEEEQFKLTAVPAAEPAPKPPCDHMELWVIGPTTARCADCSDVVPLAAIKP